MRNLTLAEYEWLFEWDLAPRMWRVLPQEYQRLMHPSNLGPG